MLLGLVTLNLTILSLRKLITTNKYGTNYKLKVQPDMSSIYF